jgi:RHS repeat-associated protein
VYDELNRKIKVIDSLSNNTEYTYNDRDNLISLKDGNGNITQFEYDRDNRLIKETRPMSEITTYQYDGLGNLIQKIDAKNQKIEYEYNDSGRLTRTKYFAVATDVTPVKTVDFTYDKAGNLTGYNDSTTSATYLYDDSYRKVSETINYGSFGLTYLYTYYKNGTKKSFTAPDGTTYEYTYDANNQISTINVPGHGVMTYNQYTWNMPDTITLPGGARQEITYSPLMQLKTIAVKDPGQNPLMTYDYQYAPAGNITAKNTEHGNYAYQYDALYRLSGATNPVSANEAYTYDAVGNRLTSANVTGTWSYNQNNELLNYDGVSNGYDDNGNTIAKTENGAAINYIYDLENRLIRVEDSNGSVIAEYYYDPVGRRLKKSVGSVTTYFLYADEGLIGEYDTSGNESKTYGYAPNSTWTTNPLFQKIGTNYYWYQNDHLGTPQKIIDTSGRTVWSATYTAFGEAVVDPSSIIINNLRFAGQYYDAETGKHYNWNRYYDPKTGTYISEDPIGFEGGDINLYSYVGNQPINRIDPLGLDDLSDLEPSGSILMIWYGNWGGPGWTGGQRGTWNSINQSAAKPPIDKQDACYRDHDICYGSCRDNKSCKSSSRANCFKNCDRKLSRCLRSLGKDPSNNWQAKAAAILFENRNPGADQ